MKHFVKRLSCIILIGIFCAFVFCGCDNIQPQNEIQSPEELETNVSTIGTPTTSSFTEQFVTAIPDTDYIETVSFETVSSETESAETKPAVTEPAKTEPTETKPSVIEPAVTEPSETTSHTTPPTSTGNFEQLKAIVDRLSGRWYLDGYSDIYLNITYEPSWSTDNSYMLIQSNGNFSLKSPLASGSDFFDDYTIYPRKNGLSFSATTMVKLSSWDITLSEYKIRIDDTCICFDTYKFVREQGTKNQYSDLDNPTEPSVTEPSVTEPAVTGPSVTEPSVTEPSVTEPLVTEPSVTEPIPSRPQPIPVSGVIINKTTLDLKVGDTQQLTVTVVPSNADNKKVMWTSNNGYVVQVSSLGEVTARGEGSATITVTTNDGGYTATCTITVAPVYTDVLIINDIQTISNTTIYTDVYITSTGVATFNNVTVNGNIYCYGQLKAQSCVANDVYAYAYGPMMSCSAFDGTHGKVTGGINCNNLTILDNALDYAFNKWGRQ